MYYTELGHILGKEHCVVGTRENAETERKKTLRTRTPGIYATAAETSAGDADDAADDGGCVVMAMPSGSSVYWVYLTS